MSLLDLCKESGFKTVQEVMHLSSMPRSTLVDMYNNPHKQERLRQVLYYCAIVKINNAMGDL